MKRILPSKKIIAFVLVPIFSFIIFFSIKNIIKGNFKKKSDAEKHLEDTILREVTKKDTDGDGLLDWEERLHKTDINKKDTDSDGVNDFFEIQSGTDPLDPFNKVNKNGIKKIDIDKEKYDYRKDPKLTITDRISRDILVKTVELKNSNLINNKSARENVVNEILQSVDVQIKDKYLKEDLKLSKKTTKESFKKNWINVLKKSRILNTEDNFILYGKFLDSQDKKYLKEIEKNIILFKKHRDMLLDLEIPFSAKKLFLDYINTFQNHIDSITLLAAAENDPIATIEAIENQEKIENKMKQISAQMELYFAK